ncbi:hypothetical protein BH18ACI5_BH18ACI5_10290 [soil metagenome]
MTVLQQTRRIAICLCLVGAMPTHGFAQLGVSSGTTTGGPLSGLPVANAPLSADATTTLRQILADGTRITRTGTARYYRDSLGRVRIEQKIMGIEALNPSADGQVRITVQPDPTVGMVYTLDPGTRTARKGPRFAADVAVGGGRTFAVPLGGVSFMNFARAAERPPRNSAAIEESLGNRQIEGVEAVGRRVTTTIPAGEFGNDRPIEIRDERWESPEMKMLIYSSTSDPRFGVVEYRLTNIRRTEPDAELFEVPGNYTIVPNGTDPWISLVPPSYPKYGKGRGGEAN